MKRVMVNLDDATGAALEKRAAVEKRAASNYISLLVEKDLRSAGLMPDQEVPRAELLALAEEVGISTAIETLRGKLRRTGGTKGKAA